MTLCTPWASILDFTACGGADDSGDIAELALESASEVLYALTGRQYPGTCEATLRPCANGGSNRPFGWTYPWFPIRVGGSWLNIGGCGCHTARDCACNPYPRVNLGRDDIQSITEVLIDDVVLDPGSYRLDSNHYLVRTDGEGWPCCQDLSLDSGVGTWSIALTYGDPVPQYLVSAAAVYAMELVKACLGDSTCRLPKNVVSLVKQGVSMEFADSTLLTGGFTGIPEVDIAIRAANPNGISRAAVVRSPEVRSVGVWT